MKDFYYTLFCFFITTILIAQVQFEKGYVIDDNGSKIDCLIKNLDWGNNPTEIQYKLNETSEVINGSISNLKEFRIGNNVRYLRATVQMDQSSTKASNFSTIKEPKFVEETVFLKQIISGEANLYRYQNNKFERFFYSTKTKQITPLVYKKYTFDRTRIYENAAFRKELFENLKCDKFNFKDFLSIDYSKDELIKIFSKNNLCVSGENGVLQLKNKKGKFNFRIKGGLSSSFLDVDYDESDLQEDRQSAIFSKEISPRIAIEAEYVLPINKNKWSVFIEPGFQSYSGTSQITVERITMNVESDVFVDYKAFDIPIGLRHYMFINEKSKLFINFAVALAFDLSDVIVYENSLDLDIKSGSNLFFGLGYEFDNRFSLEFRTSTKRDILTNYGFYSGHLSNTGFVVGYKFL